MKNLRNAVKELGTIVELLDADGNEIKVTPKTTKKQLEDIIKGAIPLLEEGDELSEETMDVIGMYSVQEDDDEDDDIIDDEDEDFEDDEEDFEDDDEDPGIEDEDDDGGDVPGTGEDEDYDDDEDPGIEDDDAYALFDEVSETEKLADLKEIANDNDEFKTLRKKLNTYKKANDLRSVMLQMLERDKVEEIHKKNIASKPVRTSTKEAPVKAKAKEEPAKEKKPFPQKEGSMAVFMDNLVREGGTWKEIAAECAVEGEKRDLRTKFTPSLLKAHVKFRLSKDSKFLGKLKVTDAGIE